jgi:hypothetical protein
LLPMTWMSKSPETCPSFTSIRPLLNMRSGSCSKIRPSTRSRVRRSGSVRVRRIAVWCSQCVTAGWDFTLPQNPPTPPSPARGGG